MPLCPIPSHFFPPARDIGSGPRPSQKNLRNFPFGDSDLAVRISSRAASVKHVSMEIKELATLVDVRAHAQIWVDRKHFGGSKNPFAQLARNWCSDLAAPSTCACGSNCRS